MHIEEQSEGSCNALPCVTMGDWSLRVLQTDGLDMSGLSECLLQAPKAANDQENLLGMTPQAVAEIGKGWGS